MIDEILTMVPGPTPVHPRILSALAEPTISHQAPAFVSGYAALLKNLREIAFTAEAHPFVLAGAGTLAMEMALVNILAPGEKILIISQGYFGDRFAQLAQPFAIPYDILQSPWGEAVAPEALEKQLRNASYAAVTITHVDTSTGTCAPVQQYCRILADRPEMVVLDGVCATGGIEERFDDWGIDVLLTAPQKAFGTPPGLTMTLFSSRAVERRKALPTVPAFYADILRWLPVMENPALYYSTPAVNEIRALHEATVMMLEEGMENRFRRHRRFASAFRSGLHALGLELFTAADALASTLSVVKYPQEIEDLDFRAAMARRGVVVAGALGPIAGRAFRIGHMGNIGVAEVCKALSAIEAGLNSLSFKTPSGAAAAAAAAFLNE